MVVPCLSILPQPPLLFKHTPESILEETIALVNYSRATREKVLKQHQSGTATFSNAIVPLIQAETSRALQAPVLGLYEDVATNSELREASEKAQNILRDFYAENRKNEELYGLVHTIFNKEVNLGVESRRFLEDTLRNFKRNGLDVQNQAKRDRLDAIRQRIKELQSQFERNRASEDGSIWFTPKELEGAPQSVLEDLEEGREENFGKLRIRFSNQDHHRIFPSVLNRETRKRYNIANNNKCKQNVVLLKETAILRDEAAHILGRSDHASFRLEERMAKNPTTVNNFLHELKTRLTPDGKAERDALKALMQADMDARGEEYDGTFFPWDFSFYNRLSGKQNSSFDQMKFAEYFPVQVTIKRMLGTYEHLFGLRFQLIDDKTADMVWHEEVEFYTVWNDDNGDGEFLGYLYIDLFSRDGKCREIGMRICSRTALICNFAKPTPKKPALLPYNDLMMVFHELGHGIHNLVSKTSYARFHGTSVPVDFGEAPSQMLENWCRTGSFLKALAVHYSSVSPEYGRLWEEIHKDELKPSAEIPDEMIDGVLRTRFMHSPMFHLNQLQMAMFDMTIHQPHSHEEMENMDLLKEWNQSINALELYDATDESDWSCAFAELSHIMGDEYDAGFYSYQFSQVYSTDMFYTAFKSDLKNREQGLRYRRVVLEPGGSQDEMQILTNFLGRQPSVDAFYKDLGLN